MTEMETRQYLEIELQKVKRWEQNQKDLSFWEKIGRLPFALLDRLTPKFIQDKLGKAIDELGGYIQTGGQYLISKRSVLNVFRDVCRESAYEGPAPASPEEIGNMPLYIQDLAAARLAERRKAFAAIQGATTGFGGLFTLAADVPALLGVTLKVIQETALCYGFNPLEKKERLFAVKCLQFSSADIVGKRAILGDLESFGEEPGHGRIVSELQGWREVVATYRDSFGWKKLFQAVPVAGMLFGAYLNKGAVSDAAETAQMLYRKRSILRKLALADQRREGI
jgi:hypothetical protein